jgi:serine/threonine-protein kinase
MNKESPPAQAAPDNAESAVTRLQPTAVQHGIPPGTLLVNTYRVERLLGGGGMGEVYLAQHTGLGTEHAVKVIRPAMAMDRKVMDLFYREARVLRGVRHDAVVNYDGFVRDDRGRDYLVMEYAEGPSLSDRLRGGPLPPNEVLALRDRLAAGLSEAHRRGAIHRDISPDNIILCGGRIEHAKLIDFGLCKLTDPTQQSIVGSAFAGKFRYASPEQFGLFGGGVDARSDIYSLGLVLAAAARGRPLDMGESFEAALRSRRSVPDLSDIPAELRGWIGAMLEPDPARRPQSMQAVIELVGRGRTVVGTTAGRKVLRRRPAADGLSSRGTLKRVATGAALAITIVAAAWTAYVLLRPPAPAPGPEPGIDGLIAADRLDDAFALAQQRIAAGDPPSRPQTWALLQALRRAGQQDPAFALARELARSGDGPAAFLIAEMYDPLHWSPETSPFSRPNEGKATEWYRRAADAGVADASASLKALGERQQ